MELTFDCTVHSIPLLHLPRLRLSSFIGQLLCLCKMKQQFFASIGLKPQMMILKWDYNQIERRREKKELKSCTKQPFHFKYCACHRLCSVVSRRVFFLSQYFSLFHFAFCCELALLSSSIECVYLRKCIVALESLFWWIWDIVHQWNTQEKKTLVLLIRKKLSSIEISQSWWRFQSDFRTFAPINCSKATTTTTFRH